MEATLSARTYPILIPILLLVLASGPAEAAPARPTTPKPSFAAVPSWTLEYELKVDGETEGFQKLHAVIVGQVVLGSRNLGAALSTNMPAASDIKPNMKPSDAIALSQKMLASFEHSATWARTPPGENVTSEAALKAYMDSANTTVSGTYDIDQGNRIVRAHPGGEIVPATIPMFDLDETKKVYSLSFPIKFAETEGNSDCVRGEEKVRQSDGSWVTNPFAMSWGVADAYEADEPVKDVGNAWVISGTLPDSLAPISGQRSFRIRYNTTGTGTLVARYTLRYETPPEVRLVFDAQDAIWRPTPGPDEDTPDKDNPCDVYWFVDQPSGKKVDVERVTFDLVNVSGYPGVCMNWPETPKKDPHGNPPDLRFEHDPSQTDIQWDADGLSIRITGKTAAKRQGTITIQSFDGAAMGQVVATAKLADGRVITGEVPPHGLRPGRGELLVPNRDQNSDIATSWIDEYANGKGEGSDEDAKPKGDGQTGDGLTMWEEYRGFWIGGAWTDTDPNVKDLFIDNRVGPMAESGMKLLERASGLKVHGKLTKLEHKINRVINFNARSDRHVVDQHCLRVRESATKEYGIAEPVAGARFDGPPKNTDWINVLLGLSTSTLYPDPNMPSGYASQSDQAAHVAHELGHGIGIYHHGDRDAFLGVYWVRQPADLVQERGRGNIQIVFDPALQPVNVDQFFRGRSLRRVFLGEKFGQHSGDTDCFMRYNCARAYRLVASPTKRVWFGSIQPPGRTLCTSPAGTGFNMPNQDPESWFSGADRLRGDCLHQFVISDAHEITYRDEKAQAGP